jgi:hypothetical protein
VSKPLGDARTAIETWMRSVAINVAADVVPPQGDVGSFRCTYHENMGKGAGIGLTLAEVFVKVYVSRAHEPSGHLAADDAQSTLQESLESVHGPWAQLLVTSSDVIEENLAEATYEAVRFTVQIWL